MFTKLIELLAKTKDSHKNLLIGLTIALVTLICFANSLLGEFISDDHALIEENPNIRALSTIPKLFLTSYFYNVSSAGLYRPITNTSFALDFAINGLDPYGYHLTNILIHIVNCWLIYWLCNHYCKTKLLALMCALFFAVHPVHGEAVCAIYGRADLLATMFLLIAWFGYVKATQNNFFYFLSLISFLLSLLCKESGIVLIGILLLLQVCNKTSWSESLKLNKKILGYIFAIIPYLLVRSIVTKAVGIPKSGQMFANDTFMTRVYTMSLGYLKYFKILLWPIELCSEYNNEIIAKTTVLTLAVTISLIIILAIFFIGIWQIKKNPIVAFAILFFYVTTSIVSNIVIPTGMLIAERVIYLATGSICLLAAIFIYHLYLLGWQKVSLAIFLILLIAASSRTYLRTFDFQSDFTLLTSVLKVSPDYVASNHSLGSYYEARGELDKAEIYFRKALKKDPTYGGIYATLANLYMKQGRYDEALPLIEQQLTITPNSVFAHVAMARFYQEKQEYQKTVDSYLLAVKYSLPNARLEQELALAFYRIKDLEQASLHLNKAIQLDPYFAEPLVHLARILQEQKLYDQAQLILNKALKLDPNDADAYTIYGENLFSQGNLCEAKTALVKALSLNQFLADTHYKLGLVYREMNLYKEAQQAFQNALTLNPKLSLAREQLIFLKENQASIKPPIICPN